MRNNIAFDIDGVILDPFPKMKWILEKYYNIKINEDNITSYNIEDCYPKISKEIMNEVISKMTYYKHPLKTGAYDFLHKLRCCTDSDPIIFYTSRLKDTMYYTYENLKYHFTYMPFYIHFACGNKSKVAENFKYFVEDKKETVINLANLGVKVFVPIMKHNMGIVHENVEYINSMLDLVPRVEGFII